MTNNQVKRIADSPDKEKVLEEMIQDNPVDVAKLSRLTNMTEAELHNGALKVMQDLTGQGLENIDISKLPIEKVDALIYSPLKVLWLLAV